MTRLTDERITEILAPPDIAGETELQALAREVRELRHKLKEAEASGMLFSPVEMVQQIERLTRERDEAQRTIDLQCRQIAHQARQCQEIEDELAAANIVREKLTEENKRLLLELRDCDTAKIELAEARELLRLFRIDDAAACEQYDRKYGKIQPQQPEPAGELVPWTAETRPRGVVMFRHIGGDNGREWAVVEWLNDGPKLNHGSFYWIDMFRAWEWSRDGVTWQRCGVEVTK